MNIGFYLGLPSQKQSNVPLWQFSKMGEEGKDERKYNSMDQRGESRFLRFGIYKTGREGPRRSRETEVKGKRGELRKPKGCWLVCGLTGLQFFQSN